MSNISRDVMGAGCLNDDVGKVVVEEHKLLDFGDGEHTMMKNELSNEKFAWNRKGPMDLSPVCGPREKITVAEVDDTISRIKTSKAAGPSDVVAE